MRQPVDPQLRGVTLEERSKRGSGIDGAANGKDERISRAPTDLMPRLGATGAPTERSARFREDRLESPECALDAGERFARGADDALVSELSAGCPDAGRSLAVRIGRRLERKEERTRLHDWTRAVRGSKTHRISSDGTRTTLEHGGRQLLQAIAHSASYRGFARHARLESNHRSRRHLSRSEPLRYGRTPRELRRSADGTDTRDVVAGARDASPHRGFDRSCERRQPVEVIGPVLTTRYLRFDPLRRPSQ